MSLEEKEEALISLIKDNLSTQRLKNVRAFFVVPERLLITRRFTIPSIPLSEINSALKFHLKGEITWDMEKTVYVWKIIQERREAGGVKKLDLIVSLIPEEKIDNILKLCRRIGVSCYGIHSQFFLLANLFNFVDIQGTVGVLDIGGTDTSFMVLKKNTPLFLRKIPFSSGQLTRAMMENFENRDVSFDEVESVKREHGLSGELFSYMRSSLERLTSEIKKSIEYYNSEFEEVQLSRIYLLGGGSQLKELSNLLSGELKLEVESFPLIKDIEVSKELDREKILAYLPGLSGAIYEKRINFLPKGLRVSKLEEIEDVLLRTGIPLLSLVFLVLFLNATFQVNSLKRRFKYAGVHLDTLKDIRKLKDKIKVKDKLLSRVTKSYIPGEWVMKSISTHLPPGIVLEKIDLDLNRNIVALSGYLLDISDAEGTLTGYVKKLRNMEIFEEVNIANIVKTTEKSRKIATFQMSCKLIALK